MLLFSGFLSVIEKNESAETPDLPFILRLSVKQHKRQNQQIYILCL